jgi:hypothetical protein
MLSRPANGRTLHGSRSRESMVPGGIKEKSVGRKLAENRWWRLYNDLEIDTWAGRVFTPLPTMEMLDDFEARTGFKLPPSFREFALLFGGGEVAGWYNVFVPYGEARREAEHLKWSDLDWYNEHWQELVRDRSFRWNDPDRLRRLVFFSQAWSGPWFGWDPEDQTPNEPLEYRVHLRDRLEDQTELVADSFEQFVTKYCFTQAPASEAESEGDRDHRYFFAPTSVKAKSADEGKEWPNTNCQRMRDLSDPLLAASGVDAAWLRWNDQAVLKLAYRIHAEDRFQDLPILADALEEAGCGNEAVLSHLRCGAWHLRNCWVLKAIFDKE